MFKKNDILEHKGSNEFFIIVDISDSLIDLEYSISKLTNVHFGDLSRFKPSDYPMGLIKKMEPSENEIPFFVVSLAKDIDGEYRVLSNFFKLNSFL